MEEARNDLAMERELERRLKEHREKLEKQYNEKCSEITASVEKDKAMLLNQLEEHKREMKRKHDENIKKEKNRIRERMETEFEETVVRKCKEEFEAQEIAEKERLRKESEYKIKEYEKELRAKYEKDKEELKDSFKLLIEKIDRVEKQKADLEIQQYKTKIMKPTASLTDKLLVSRIENERQLIINKHESKVAELKRDAQLKLEREKQQALLRHQEELLNIEMQGHKELEMKIEKMRVDNERLGERRKEEEKMEREVKELEAELNGKLSALKSELEEKYSAEKQRKAELAKKSIEEYESELKAKFEAEVKGLKEEHEANKEALRKQLDRFKEDVEAERCAKIEEHRVLLDKRLKEKIKELESNKAKLLNDLNNEANLLGVESADREVLLKRLKEIQTQKENKIRECDEIDKSIESTRKQIQEYSFKIREVNMKIEEIRSKAILVLSDITHRQKKTK
eukprot:TRINITY_DN5628_c0_g2_i2.p2 TRINITY_DN5628_c0_g2~~TRINITY_DN5628_c0_g2_i2.p2  ORF type:complete len:456 (-),score=159.69 TRINITY_DN5628_c0_g2_i2:867-2234(-)